MSEERRQVHPQEPAEGAGENEETPGAEKSGDREPARGPSDEARSRLHSQEPAEGSREDVEAPGVEEARDDLGAPEDEAETPGT